MFRSKILVSILLIIAAVTYLIISSMRTASHYFITVKELVENAASYSERSLRISGAVIGDTIQYDPQSLTLRFTIADIPADNKEIEAAGGLAQALHEAVTDPHRTRLDVVYHGPRPDLLRDEAQAIITGKIGDGGVFVADEILLKCPTRYEEAMYDYAEKANLE